MTGLVSAGDKINAEMETREERSVFALRFHSDLCA